MSDVEERLRAALRAETPPDGVGERVRRHVAAVLPDVPARRRVWPARLARPALTAVGVLAIAGLIVALLVSAGRDDGTTLHPDVPPPSVFGVLDRPQTPRESAVRITDDRLFAGPVAARSIRIADVGDGERFLVARTTTGMVCALRDTGRGEFGEGCRVDVPSPPEIQASTPDGVGGERTVFGLVPDGIAAVVVDGRSTPVINNVFHALVAGDATRVALDFVTHRGVVAAWHQELRLDPRVDRLLARGPYLGVACRITARRSCDRIGVAVWLRAPARSVRVRIDGRGATLDDPIWSGEARAGLRRMFAGFLQPAGLIDGALRIPATPAGRWAGSPAVGAPVTVEVIARDGARTRVTVQARLFPGWG